MTTEDDLVSRLRSEAANWSRSCGDLFDKAADEIDRLRAENERLERQVGYHAIGHLVVELEHLRAENERLRSALKEIAGNSWNGADFCHPEGCFSPWMARCALAGGEGAQK